MTITEVESILTTREAQGVRLAILRHPDGGFQCRRVGRRGELQRIGAPGPSPGILDAARDADAACAALLANEREGEASTVVDFLSAERLRRITVPGEGRFWEAEDGAGGWGQPEPTPRAAVRAALRRDAQGQGGALRPGEPRVGAGDA